MVDAALLASVRVQCESLIGKYMAANNGLCIDHDTAVNYAMDRLLKSINENANNVLGDAIEGQYDYSEHGQLAIESYQFLLTGAPDLLFNPTLAMNTELTNDPTFIEVVVSALPGTVIKHNIATIKTMTVGIDSTEVYNMGATLTANVLTARIPFNRQLNILQQIQYSIQGAAGAEVLIHYIGWSHA